MMTNHILQLLARFHQNLMKRFQIMPKIPHFLTLIPIVPGLRFFFKKTKTSHSSHNQVTTLCQKSEQSYEPFLRSQPNGRTNGQRLNHKPKPLRGGPKTLKTVNFGQKIALNGPNFTISHHTEYDFLKEDHKNIFHAKN